MEEPYFAVSRPSDTVVLEARPTVKAAKRLRPVEVACELLPRSYYAMGRSQESLELLFASEAKTPPELLQARNAVDIARLAGAERYSKDRLDEATRKLLQANALLRTKDAPKQAASVASEAVVAAELARQIALQRAVDEAVMIREVETARREAAAAAEELEKVRLEGRLEAERREAFEQRLKDEVARRETFDRRREAATAAEELEKVRLEGRLEAERREAVEQRLKGEVALREAFERQREAEIVTPPPAPPLEKSDLEQERQAVQSEFERMRSELNAERERMLNDVAKQVQTQAELERARMQVALAEERAEMRVERVRLEAERQVLEARQQRPEPVPTSIAEPALPEVRPAEKAPQPAVAAEPEDTAESVESRRLSTEITAAREALVLEQAELRALREDLRAELGAARQRETDLPAEISAEAPEPEPAKKRRWWFGRRKADPETPPPVESVRVMTSDLDEERRWIQSEQARLNAERKELDAQRRELQANSEQVQPKVQRWWFGGKKNGAATEPVVVQDSGMAVERSRLDAERSRMRAEAETAKAELAAERAQLEAEMDLRMAEQEAREKGERIEGLDRRVAELEATATARPLAGGEPVDKKQAELATSIEQLRAELAALKAERVETAPWSPAGEQPAWRADLAKLLGAERTPRGLVVRLPDLSFETSKHELRPDAREQIARVAGILQSAPGARIEIEGHTDSTGDPAFNQRLSELRAAAVMNYLATRNVPVEAMRARGLGDTKPAASNETRDGRNRNRRVELIVTGDGDVTAKNRGRGNNDE